MCSRQSTGYPVKYNYASMQMSDQCEGRQGVNAPLSMQKNKSNTFNNHKQEMWSKTTAWGRSTTTNVNGAVFVINSI